ncbi:MAG: alpha/beta hydrolase [Clostridia bacterium]|nr:alpha/beta hydrolase [Clostridia bacterium]
MGILNGHTPPVRDIGGKVKEGSIAVIEEISLSGIKQYIYIRGHSIKKPVLLFLHGGPGGPEVGVLRRFNSALEEHFVVVQWDQRGAGRSYNPDIPAGSMTSKQIVQDACELIQMLKKRFEKEKVFVMGHSFGTIFGLLLAQQYPEHIEAYIGVSQVVNRKEEEIKSYEFVFNKAQTENNKKAIKQLEMVGFPKNGCYKNVEDLVVQRKWLGNFGGVTKNLKDLTRWYLSNLFTPEYPLSVKLKPMEGMKFSMKYLWNQLMDTNFLALDAELKVPALFCMGRHDRITWLELVEEYCNKLKAPQKEVVVFENSGHMPNSEEAEKFNELLINRLKAINEYPKDLV